jgi:hypothetical protein
MENVAEMRVLHLKKEVGQVERQRLHLKKKYCTNKRYPHASSYNYN